MEIRPVAACRHLDVVIGDADESIRKADNGTRDYLELRVAEGKQLPERGTGSFELRRYRRRLVGHPHQGLVVMCAQVSADCRIDNRGDERQRTADDRADSDRDPGAQAQAVVLARLSYAVSHASGNAAISVTLGFLAFYCAIAGVLALGRALARGPTRLSFWVFVPRWLDSKAKQPRPHEPATGHT